MKLPQGAGLLKKDEEKNNDAIIYNKYSGKGHLTREEAMDQINFLSGMLLADVHYTRRYGGKDAGNKGI